MTTIMYILFSILFALLQCTTAIPTPPRQSFEDRSAQRRRLLGLDEVHLPLDAPRSNQVDWRDINSEFSRLNIHDAVAQAQERLSQPRTSANQRVRTNHAATADDGIDPHLQAEIEEQRDQIRDRMRRMTPGERRRYIQARRDESNRILSELEVQRQREAATERTRVERIESGDYPGLNLALRQHAREERLAILATPMGTRRNSDEDEDSDTEQQTILNFDTPR